MRDHTSIGPWVRRFLLEHLVTDRNLARNTQFSYRDTLVLLLPFMSKARGKAVDRLSVDDLSPAVVRSFLEYLEKERGCSGATRNLRLATIHSLAKFIAMHNPEQVAWCAEVRGPVQEDGKADLALPGQAGNGCATDEPRRGYEIGNARLRFAAIAL